MVPITSNRGITEEKQIRSGQTRGYYKPKSRKKITLQEPKKIFFFPIILSTALTRVKKSRLLTL